MNPDQIRPMLLIALAGILFLMWEQWQADYGPKPTPPALVTEQTVTATGLAPAQVAEVPAAPADAGLSQQPANTPATTSAALPAAANTVTVWTDTVRAVIDTRGGTIRSLALLKYPIEIDRPDKPLHLLEDELPNLFVAQSGLIGDDAPNHHVELNAERSSYRLADGAQIVEVPLTWRSESGVVVRKIYIFSRDSYVVRLRYEVDNQSATPWTGRLYGQLLRTQVAEDGGLNFIYTYMGGVLSSDDKPYEKVDFSDMVDADIERDVSGGWAAMIQHYFAAAWIPRVGTEDQPADVNHYYTKALSGARYVIGVMTPNIVIAPGASDKLELSAYLGPKDQVRMTNAAPGLDRTVDYGWLFIIAQPVFWALTIIHSFVGNWGWAIILLTVSIKLLFFHLSAASYRSMARMRKLQPKLVALRERFGDDRTKLNQSMMELYKKEKINPLGGCLPILIQIPVFISLYWVLLESVELRHAPFMFWLYDLSTKDPYYVLPVIMGISMIIQQRLNPTPPDPIQAKVMMALPFIFTFFFLNFPSGLVLYWVVNNTLSIAQQWVITRKIEAEK